MQYLFSMSFNRLNAISDFVIHIFNLLDFNAHISHDEVFWRRLATTMTAVDVIAACRLSVCDNLIKNLIFVCMRCKLLLLKIYQI